MRAATIDAAAVEAVTTTDTAVSGQKNGAEASVEDGNGLATAVDTAENIGGTEKER